MSCRVRFAKADEQHSRLGQELEDAVLGCLRRGDLINRGELRRFEQELAAFVGTRHAVGVNSGYHALALSLIAAGIGPGDEIIVPGHTFLASVSAIIHAGARPVLVDIGVDHNIDPGQVEAAVTARTKAIMPVHLNGRVCDMTALGAIARRHRLFLIEDACQGLGATFWDKGGGSFGLAGCFSFYPFKLLGCYGDGGAVTTNDAALAEAVRRLRYNGEDRETGEYHYHGFSALLDNVQAAALSVKLPHLSQWIEHRRAMAELYRGGLEGIGDLTLPHYETSGNRDTYQNYVVRTGQRDQLRAWLMDRGIETLVSWPKPMWQHPALKLPDPHLPGVEALCKEVLSLPMNSEITAGEVGIVCEAIRDFFAQGPESRFRESRYAKL